MLLFLCSYTIMYNSSAKQHKYTISINYYKIALLYAINTGNLRCLRGNLHCWGNHHRLAGR